MKKFIFIFLSFIAAFSLMILPLPIEWKWYKPEWISLFLIFWIFAYPQSVGVLTAFCVGLVMDILGGGLLGQYAFSLVIVAYFASMMRNRFRLFPWWQQIFVILLLVGAGNVALLLVQWLIGHPPQTLLFWLTCVTSMFAWPVVAMLLRLYERKTIR